MRTLIDLNNILNELRSVSGTNAKLINLRMADAPELREIIKAILDPNKMYGIKTVPPISGRVGSDLVGLEALMKLLKDLADRELTGNAAREAVVHFLRHSTCPSELLQRCFDKSLDCGLAATSVNKVFPGLVPEFNVALAEPYEGQDLIWPLQGSIKYDGNRCFAFVTIEGEVTLKSRGGLEITSAEHIKAVLEQEVANFRKGTVEDWVFDGELKARTGHFQDSSGSVRKKSKQNEQLCFYIFDYMTMDQFLANHCPVKQKDRSLHLEEWGNWFEEEIDKCIHVVKEHKVRNPVEAKSLFERFREQGHEGLMLKDPEAPYSFGRSSAWLKMKDVKEADCKVLSLLPGTGKYQGMVGALVVDFKGKPNKVGSGLSDEQRQLWQDSPELILDTTVEVHYHEETKDGNMRHSRLFRLRPDKD